MKRLAKAMVVVALMGSVGCAVHFAKRSPWDIQRLKELGDQLEQFKTLAHLKTEEADELRRAKTLMEAQLGSSQAEVGYDERGLVARLVDQVLFDSGKAILRRTEVLDKVAKVLQEFPNQPVGIEGHTDNVPITHSGWASNKELSMARAKAVSEYLTHQHGIADSRLIVVGNGEERPIASNDTAEGRKKNRRVEIVLLPKESSASYQAQAEKQNSRKKTSYVK